MGEFRFNWPAAFTVIGVVFCLSILFALQTCVRAPNSAGEALVNVTTNVLDSATDNLMKLGSAASDKVAQVLNVRPKVVINNETISGQSAPIAEFAVLTQEMSLQRGFEQTFLHSTKRFGMKGVFRVKAGFDLQKEFTVKISSSDVRVVLPPAKILSVEMERYETVEDKSGVWNKITQEERDREMNALLNEARLKAEGLGIEKRAEDLARAQLQAALVPISEKPVVVEILSLTSGDGVEGSPR